MKRIILFLSFIICIINNAYTQSQNCDCKADLTFLDSKIRKTPAFKNNKKAYQDSYSKFSKEAVSIKSLYECYVLMNELMIPLNDNHSRVYGINLGATEAVIADPEKYSTFKNSALFNTYPKSSINLDSLKRVLANKPKLDIEGVYKAEDYITIGVFKSKDDRIYKAIILDSNKNLWKAGEIIYTMIPFGNEYLLNIGGKINSKRLIAYPERIENGIFQTMGYKKDITQINYASKMPSDSTYYREELSDKVTYLKIGSFNSWYPTLSDAEKFYKSLEGNLQKPNLIIDLRNNGGGGDRNSDILYDILKDYAKNNKIYLITNHNTVSNAEQFTYKLNKLENCEIFGSRSNGRLAYEIKNGNYPLPCDNFIAVLTSKKHGEFLEFESQGIEPNVKLDMGSDWIIQVKNYISNEN